MAVVDLLRFIVDPWELFVRGSAVYWFLLLLFRFVLRRDAGSLAVTDIMLLVLVADASQNAMSGGYETLADGAAVVLTLAGWNYLLDWLSYRSPTVRRVLEPAPLMLVQNGRALRSNLKREMVTMDELMAAMRQQGIDDIALVKSARMEADGHITVIRR